MLIYDSPIYRELIQFINDVLDIFAEIPSCRWATSCVSIHLKKRYMENRTKGQLQERTLPPNVRIVSGRQLNTYALMDCCEFGITINSQSGLEMLSKHKPVIVTGTAFYANKGFTGEIKSREELSKVVKEYASNPHLNDEQIKMIDIFLYKLIFHYLIPYDQSTYSFSSEATALVMRELKIISSNAPKHNVLHHSKNDVSDQVEQLYLLGLESKNSNKLADALKYFQDADRLVLSHGTKEERYELLLHQIQLSRMLQKCELYENLLDALNEIKVDTGLSQIYFDLARQHASQKDDDATIRLMSKDLLYSRIIIISDSSSD